jgi:hypothetical protein
MLVREDKLRGCIEKKLPEDGLQGGLGMLLTGEIRILHSVRCACLGHCT